MSDLHITFAHSISGENHAADVALRMQVRRGSFRNWHLELKVQSVGDQEAEKMRLLSAELTVERRITKYSKSNNGGAKNVIFL